MTQVEGLASRICEYVRTKSLFVAQDDLETRFDAEVVADGGYTPRYNIAPGDDLEVITNEAEDEIGRYH